MLPYYLFAGFLFFGLRKNDQKGVHERTGRHVSHYGDTQLAERGDACAKFERRAPELCMMTSREVKLDLTIMMANCQLETVGAPPLQYDNSRDMAKGSDADKIIVMQMLPTLPDFCQALATYGLNINYMNMQSTMDIVNYTYEKLDEITKIASDFEEENKKGIAQTERLLEVSEKRLRQAKKLSDNTAEMQGKLTNFNDELVNMLNAFTGFERRAEEVIKQDNETAELIKNYTEDAREMMQNLDVHAYETRETQLSFEVLQYQVLLALIIAWYVMSKASFNSFGILAFMLVIFLIAALSTMQFGSILAMYRAAKQLTKTVNYLSDNSLELKHLIAMAVAIILIPLTFSYLRRFRRRKGGKVKDLPQSIYENFDFHNSRDVLALLQVQKKFIEQQKERIDKLLTMTNSAIEISKQEEPALYGQPVKPSTAFYRSKWRRSPVGKSYTYEDRVSTSEMSPSFITYVTDSEQITPEDEVKQTYGDDKSNTSSAIDAERHEVMESTSSTRTARSTSKKRRSQTKSEIEPIHNELEAYSEQEDVERSEASNSKAVSKAKTARSTSRKVRSRTKSEIEPIHDDPEENPEHEDGEQTDATDLKAVSKANTAPSTSRKGRSKTKPEIKPIHKDPEENSEQEDAVRTEATNSKATSNAKTARSTSRKGRSKTKTEIEPIHRETEVIPEEDRLHKEAPKTKTKATKSPLRRRGKPAPLPGGPMPPSPRATMYTSDNRNTLTEAENEKRTTNTSTATTKRNKRKSGTLKTSALEKVSRRVTKSVKKTIAPETENNEAASASTDGPASGRRRSKRINPNKKK